MIPQAPSALDADLAPLAELVGLVGTGGGVVLTGAGLSTESGIPDYRGPSGAARRHTPMTYQLFTSDAVARRRYWARSYVGWSQMASARPNDGHRAVASLQRAGLDRVRCLYCEARIGRDDVEALLHAANPDFRAEVLAVNPDGDAEIADEHLDPFVVPPCPACGVGPLKPDVVFFGETVPKDRVARCFELVDAARWLLVLGSSLTVMSGYRFVIRARQLGVPVAVVNDGPTRADPGGVDVRVSAQLGPTLNALVTGVLGGRDAPPNS